MINHKLKKLEKIFTKNKESRKKNHPKEKPFIKNLAPLGIKAVIVDEIGIV
ncbi:hypothetical protein OGM63_26385 [Plectonema radiosum NIES-515]|jgi:hypothetical protein|uniref:Transposase n=1 Tax=Plectonema radiosum NIES-515 TaxID=2986073 RepID=A0ABT3B6I8_9CYAN|nr:hypothetical protein [Plectonema radiosum]MCV3216992.1 hypothetical protein [Plectonema radiosum NIES-515]